MTGTGPVCNQEVTGQSWGGSWWETVLVHSLLESVLDWAGSSVVKLLDSLGSLGGTGLVCADPAE